MLRSFILQQYFVANFHEMVKVKGHKRDLNFNSINFSETLFSGMEQFIVIFVPENDHCTFLKQILIPINVNWKLFAYDSPCVPYEQQGIGKR